MHLFKLLNFWRDSSSLVKGLFYAYFIQPVHDQLLTLLMKSIRFLSAKSVLYHYQRRSIRSECIQFWMNSFDNLVTSQIILIQIFYGKKKLVSNKTTRHKFQGNYRNSIQYDLSLPQNMTNMTAIGPIIPIKQIIIILIPLILW